MHQSTQQISKLLGLEVLRFISSFSVLFWHYQHFFYNKNGSIDLFTKEQQPLYSLFSVFYNYGYWGVQVFWCISGFIFFWKYREIISSNVITYKKFFVLRFSRLYPLHLFTLILVLALQAIYFDKTDYFFVYENNDLPHFIYQLFLASNWGFEKGYSFNGPIWSISVEVLAYCIFFIILQKISKSFFVNIGILLLCLAAIYFKIDGAIFNCLAYFYIGGLSAIAFRYIQSTKYTRYSSYLLLFIIFAYPTFVYFTGIYQQKYIIQLFSMSYIPIIVCYGAHPFSAPLVLQKMIVVAGNMTYSSYLIHFPLQLAIALYFLNAERQIPYYSTLFFIGFFFTTFVLSHYIYRFFELPAQKYLRDKFT